jgi:beta-glucanase (GH16 family)
MKQILFFLIVSCSFSLLGQLPSNDPHWVLIWEDNFNSLDTSKWFIQDNFDHYGDKHVYIKNNVYVDSGMLVCELKNEAYSCPEWAIEPNWHCVTQASTQQPYNYTSGWIESKQAYNTQYGYIEAKIKFPFNQGLLPAFWTFRGEGVSNPINAGEIDIAEMLGSLDSNVITTNIHRDYESNENFYEEIIPWDGYNWEDWHTYSIQWSPDRLIWRIDEIPIRTLYHHNIVDPGRIVLNLAISRKDSLLGTLAPPYKMQVEHVKVYQLKSDCNNDLNLCNTIFGLFEIFYDKKVKRKIIVGDNVCSNIIYSGQDIYLRASDEIIINGNFEVQTGGQLYLYVDECPD